jgi:uncharacterized protein (TIGR00661 family)
MQHPKRILVCPLDWGLGHATRCIPIIRELLMKGAEVFVAAEGRSLELLKKEFPELNFILLPGYNITYPAKGSMILKMLFSIPKLIRGIKKEHASLKEIISYYKIDIVISDNRYGCWGMNTYNVFITHQLMIKAPLGERLLRQIILSHIRNFNECWIPDNEGHFNLSGDLSHKYPLPPATFFIGPLSRFTSVVAATNSQYDVMAIISGPEPQRSIFEVLLLIQLFKSDLKCLLVSGKPETTLTTETSGKVTIVSHLNSEQMEEAIKASSVIVARSGYSTIMDLSVLNKKVIFIPTPGQTEQEYLAQSLIEKGIAYYQEQSKFDLNEALIRSEKFSGFTDKYDSGLKARIESMLSSK